MVKNFFKKIILIRKKNNLNKLRTYPKLFKYFSNKINLKIKTFFSEKIYNANEDIYLNHANELKAIFIHIPKTGGNSIQKALFNNPSVHVPWSDYYKKSPKKFDKFFKFAVVRNPWDRLVSSFFYLKNGGMNNEDKKWTFENIKDFNNFEEFVLGWINKENIYKGIHFIPQKYWICDENKKIMVDFIARLETINQDFLFIANKVGTPIKKIEKINTSDRSNYRNYYSDQTKEIVRNIYKDDIELFGYDFDT